MKFVFDMNKSRSERFSTIMDKLKNDEDVSKLLNMIMGEAMEVFISTFSDKKGNLNLTEAKVLPSEYVRKLNEKQGKSNTEHDVLILDKETMMNHQYYKVYDKIDHRIYRCPEEDLIIQEKN